MNRGFLRWLLFTALAVVIAFILWFGVRSATKVQVKRYEMTGTVLAIHAEERRLKVHNDNISGFMRPMEMEYTLTSRDALSKIKVGDTIHATLVSDGQNVWELENVTVTGSKPEVNQK
jgi:Cu/Ag efflux protein CusF